jgi:6,7-dimethyl-8-ribityllumazine synthase
MSNLAPQRPRGAFTARRNFAIVASQYNQEYVKGLTKAVCDELSIISPKSSVTVLEVPGAFEIPVVLQELAIKGGVDALIALGVIIKGQTDHAELIGRTITDSLQNIALRFRLPVIHEVLLVDNEEHARARTLETEKNRGTEAARAAVAAAHIMGTVKVTN